MPEATINEHRYASRSEDDIRLAPQSRKHVAMHAKSETELMQLGAQSELGLGIALAGGHHSLPGFLGRGGGNTRPSRTGSLRFHGESPSEYYLDLAGLRRAIRSRWESSRRSNHSGRCSELDRNREMKPAVARYERSRFSNWRNLFSGQVSIASGRGETAAA